MSHKKTKYMKSTNQLEHIKKELLPKLLKNKYSLHFREPIDAKKLNVPVSFFFLYCFIYFPYKVNESQKLIIKCSQTI